MRIHLYSQELTKEVQLVSKKADTGVLYYGVRMMLASPDILHHSPQDDDRSAVTFWIPNAKSMSPTALAATFRRMADMVETAPIPPKNDGMSEFVDKVAAPPAVHEAMEKYNADKTAIISLTPHTTRRRNNFVSTAVLS